MPAVLIAGFGALGLWSLIPRAVTERPDAARGLFAMLAVAVMGCLWALGMATPLGDGIHQQAPFSLPSIRQQEAGLVALQEPGGQVDELAHRGVDDLVVDPAALALPGGDEPTTPKQPRCSEARAWEIPSVRTISAWCSSPASRSSSRIRSRLASPSAR